MVEINGNERREGTVEDLQKNELKSRQIMTGAEKAFTLFLKLWRKPTKLKVSSRQHNASCDDMNQN